jgi:hypothetical protein
MSLGANTRFPVLVSSRQNIAQLLVKSFHQKFKHLVGMALALTKIQRSHVILGLNRFLVKVANSCLDCRKLHLRPEPPQMGPLPSNITQGFGRD